MLRTLAFIVTLSFVGPLPAALADQPEHAAEEKTARKTQRRVKRKSKRKRVKRKSRLRKKPAAAQEKVQPKKESDTRFRVGAETLLVQDKFILGPALGLRFGWFGFDLGLGLGFATSTESRDDLQGESFFGLVGGLHLVGVPLRLEYLELDVGTGVDTWIVTVVGDASEVAWPVAVALQLTALRPLVLSAKARYYLLSSDGLEAGIDRNGEAGSPVIFSFTAGGEW